MVRYCSIGIETIDNPPASMTMIAMTIAKIGRSMKNLAMARALAYFAEATVPEGAREARAAVAGVAVTGVGGVAATGVAATGPDDIAAAVAACDSTAATNAPGCTFWTPATITRSPSSRPPSTIHWLPL